MKERMSNIVSGTALIRRRLAFYCLVAVVSTSGIGTAIAQMPPTLTVVTSFVPCGTCTTNPNWIAQDLSTGALLGATTKEGALFQVQTDGTAFTTLYQFGSTSPRLE